MKFEFNEYSNTVRLQPANYLIAQRGLVWGGRWLCDPDAAVPVDLACKAFKVVFQNRTATPEAIVQALNALICVEPFEWQHHSTQGGYHLWQSIAEMRAPVSGHHR